MTWAYKEYKSELFVPEVKVATQHAHDDCLRSLPGGVARCAKMAQCAAAGSPGRCYVFYDGDAPQDVPDLPDGPWLYAPTHDATTICNWLNQIDAPAPGKPTLTSAQAFYARVTASDWNGSGKPPLLYLWWMDLRL